MKTSDPKTSYHLRMRIPSGSESDVGEPPSTKRPMIANSDKQEAEWSGEDSDSQDSSSSLFST